MNQARNALACIAAVIQTPQVVAWSPNPEHRKSFGDWARTALGLDVRIAQGTEDVRARTSNIVLPATSESPVVTAQLFYQRLTERGAGVEIALSPESNQSTVFCSGARFSPLSSSTRNWRADRL